MRGWGWGLGGAALLALGAGIWLWTNPRHVAAPATPASEAVTRTPDAGPVVRLPQGGRALPVVEASLPEGSVPVVAPTGSATLAGRVLLDGGPPAEQIELRFDSTATESSAEANGAFSTNAAGHFRQEGLPLDWKGSIRLPVPYRMADSKSPFGYTRSVTLEEPREDLVIEVFRLPALRGRLLRADHTPVVDLGLDLALYWSNGNTLMSGARSDSQGRLAVELEQDDLARVYVEVTADDGASCALDFPRDALRVDPIFGDLDMGDLFLSPGRTARLRVLGPQREPVAGARVQTRGSSRRMHADTDASGEALVPIGKEVTELEVLARGFAGVVLTPPLSEALVEVVLHPTNRLRVTLIDPQGLPWSEGRVRLSASRPPFAGGKYYPDAFLKTGGRHFGSLGGTGPAGGYGLFLTGADGVVEMQELEPGLAFVLAAVDHIDGVGAELTCPGLGAEERRDVSMVLERVPQPLRGRCVDPAGAPLAGVHVLVSSKSSGRGVGTEPDGSFVSPPLLAREVSISAELAGYVATELKGVDPAAGELILTLAPGRALRVDVRDTLGREVRVGSVTAGVPGSTRSWTSGCGRQGHFDKFPALPLEPLTVEYQLYGRRMQKELDAHTDALVFEIPPLGLLEVEVGRLSAKDGERFELTARPLDDDQLVMDRRSVLPTGGELVSLPLWPGRYELQLHSRQKSSTGEEESEQPYGSPAIVQIEAGSTARARMGP